MQSEVKDGGTWGRKLWEEATADNDGLHWSCWEKEQWGLTNGGSSYEAPGLNSGSANTREMLMEVAIVDWHRHWERWHTQNLQAMGTWPSHILTFLSILEVNHLKKLWINVHKVNSTSKIILFSIHCCLSKMWKEGVIQGGYSPTWVLFLKTTVPVQKTHHLQPHCWHCGLLFEEHFFLCLIQKALWLWSFLSSAAVFQALTADYKK